MKTKSIAAIVMALCLLTGCNSTSSDETSKTTEKVTNSSVESAKDTTIKTSEIETAEVQGKEPQITDVSETEKEILLYRDNMKIFAKLYLPEGEGTFPVTILSAGLGMSYEYTDVVASKFVEKGIASVVFDYTGTGDGSQSDGSPEDVSILTETADVNAVLDVISSLPEIDKDNIFLWGHSMGGLASTCVAQQRPDEIKGLIGVEPSYQLYDYFKDKFPDGSEIPDVVDDMGSTLSKAFVEAVISVDPFSKMPDYKRNVLIFKAHGEPNSSIGTMYPECFDKADKAFPSSQVIAIEGADHCFSDGQTPYVGETGTQMIEKSIEFIKNNID